MTETANTARVPRAWQVLYTSLCLSAGHGVALFFIVTRIHLIPSVHDMGDGEAAVLVGWFLLSIPLAVLALLLRGRLIRMASGKLSLLAMLAMGVTVIAFARYAMVVARG